MTYGELLIGSLRGFIGTHWPEPPFNLVADLRHAAAKALDLVRWAATAEFQLLAPGMALASLHLSLSLLPGSPALPLLPHSLSPLPGPPPLPPPWGKNLKTILGISRSQMEGNLEANKEKMSKWYPGTIFEFGLSLKGGPDPPPP